MSDIYETDYKSVATWLLKDDFEKLKNLAHSNNVTISSYLRAIITDVLFEEGELLNAPLAPTPPHALQNDRRRKDVIDPL